MRCSRVVVYFLTIHLAILLHLETFTLAQLELIHHVCSETGNYTINSSYKANLDALLPSLITNKPPDYFAFLNNSLGKNSDKVNAIAFCRGDVTPEVCYTCVNASAYKLREVCPNQMEAIAWYDQCMIRYSNLPIMGTVSPPSTVIGSSENVSNSDLVEFKKVLGDLLARLKPEAASRYSPRKFSIGDQNFSSSERIYVLLQCSPDLSQLECSICLDDSLRNMSKYEGNQRLRVVGPSCDFRYALNQFFAYNDSAPPQPQPQPQPQPPSLLPHPPTTTTPTKDNQSSSRSPTVIIIVPIIILLALTALTCAYLSIVKRRNDAKSEESDEETDSLHFEFGAIRAATNDFSDANKLGEGGFGSVYKGRLPEGQEIAVKRLAQCSTQGEQEFKNEIVLMARLQHRNLVRLLGFCSEGKERLLIYEFIPNGSLDHFIFDPIRCVHLSWERRYKIIGGIARGILYLHQDSRLKIIHRDLKAGNILLDGEMNPKIADFGMAKLLVANQTQGKTRKIVGTHGYMAPEYAIHGHVSVKIDVFSFGVLVLEIVSGKRNVLISNSGNVEHLLTNAWKYWRENNIFIFIDPILRGSSRNDIMRSIQIGLLCVQENRANRPTMDSVVLMLNIDTLSLPTPSPPAFVTYSSIQANNPSLGYISGVIDASITEPYPR